MHFTHLAKRIFPTIDYRWVSINDHPLISDNDDIVQQFSQVTNIPFIYAPSDHGLSIEYVRFFANTLF